MNLIIIAIFLASVVPAVLYRVSWWVRFRRKNNREKSSPFECGFDPKSSSRLPFSLRFFLLAVIFLVFDIEIVLLIALPISFIRFGLPSLVGGFIFIIILLGGLFHE